MALNNTPYVQPLTALGLTGLEAQIYGFLVTSPPVTGYRVARQIDRPTANTYKALESLLSQGAVVASEEDPRHYRAVPPVELLRGMERRFDADRDRAAEALAGLTISEGDDGVYRLHTLEQVIDRVTDMVNRAKEIVLASLPAIAALQLRTPLVDAASRGVVVIVAIDTALEMPGVEQIAAAAVNSSAVQVVVDRREMQIAAFEGEILRHAIHTSSPYLAAVHHRLLAAEQLFVAVARSLEEGLDIDNLEAFHARCRHNRRHDG